MADPKGFLKYVRETAKRRPADERVGDWLEFYTEFPKDKLRTQAARCMDCGIPFCHSGCPLGNIIPDWNDLVYRDQWKGALDRLHATNNFPEFTGRLCPAPCETSCVLGINQDPVAIKQIEWNIIDRAFEMRLVRPEGPTIRTGRSVAIVGSGPAGLAAAQQLNRAGHMVTVFERDDRIGGLLRYGIPDFKMEKRILDRRLELMDQEGVEFRAGVNVGQDLSAEELRAGYDAVVLTGGSTVPRDLLVPGRELKGIHFAMDYLTQQNRVNAGEAVSDSERILATGKRVVILGGGDTGSDCLGTVHRQAAKEVYKFELRPKPPDERPPAMPWPDWPFIMRSSHAHEEGGVRDWSINTTHFTGENGRVTNLNGVHVEFGLPSVDGRRPMNAVAGSEFALEVDMVLLAMGFVHPQHSGLLNELGIEIDGRGNVKTDRDYQTSVSGVFAAGDMRRGQSLIVWAIAEGREAARGVDRFLTGRSMLPLAGAKLEAVPA